ncbi:hypothetical protein VIGAN_04118400 [Vigna angularis var. angularis]|uniref:Remorin C-terminal domain-containing protein n=1 Tax=Vigna angularis var. angularis TaxID=157739 RepID=A0A0S3RTK1_PHAAN|nr:hypothetical protein VIGAN_04118400 [Vigna angularis var. angularis]
MEASASKSAFRRFNCEEVKIQAWVNHQIRKAEMEMKKMEIFLQLTSAEDDSSSFDALLTTPKHISIKLKGL